jgi:hypothetical protein
MLVIKKANTIEIKINLDVETDTGRLKGTFSGVARLISKPAYRELLLRLTDEQTRGEIEDADEALIRAIYVRFDGLGNETGPLDGDAAFEEVLHGQFSQFLTTAVITEHTRHLQDASQGNFKTRRGR